MKVKIKINEYDMAGAEEGKDVVVILNAIDKEYEGKISKIARTATAENGVSYFESEIEFPADELVRIGMSAEIHLITNDVKGALTVKSDTIELNEDGTAYVLVRGKDGKSVDKRDVECGASDGTYTEITKGVYEGETALKVPLSAEEMMAQMMMGE
jgi:multidrug efflux pump subunit AcrA (membrane-fusion protein)